MNFLKKWSLLSVIVVCVIFLGAYFGYQQLEKNRDAAAVWTPVTVAIDGLQENQIQSVQKVLQRMKGVRVVAVLVPNQEIMIEWDKERVSLEQVLDRLNHAGFKATQKIGEGQLRVLDYKVIFN